MIRSTRAAVTAFTLALTLFHCGGKSGGASSAQGNPPVTPAATGTLNLRLINDGSSSGLQAVNLSLAGADIQVKGSTDWRPLPLVKPGQVVDLLSLSGAQPLVLAQGESFPADTVFGALRLRLDGGTVVPAGAAAQPLTLPSELSAGLVIPMTWYVEAGKTTQLTLLLAGAQAVRPAGDAGAYQFQPNPLVLLNDAYAGQVTGRLLAADSTPLGGVAISALRQRNGATPVNQALRTVVTAADGRFTLDALDGHQPYLWVASQPLTATAAYQGQAMALTWPGGLITTQNFPPLTLPDQAFPAEAQPGSVSGTVAPAAGANQKHQVDLIRLLNDDQGQPVRFVVQSGFGTWGASETFRFAQVASGTYQLRVTGITYGNGRIDQQVLSLSDPFEVAPGAAVTRALPAQ